MVGLELLTTLSCLSDKARWSVNDFTHPHPISPHDRELIERVRRVGEGELTGIGAGILVYDLLKDVPEEYRDALITAAVYINLIVIEEFRHGVMIGILANDDFLTNFDMREFGKQNLIDLTNEPDWDIYGILTSLCLSECVNAELYRSIAKRVECPHLKKIFINIMKDEARHLSAWRDIISEIVNTDEFHRKGIENAVKSTVHFHNASIGGSYTEGVKDTFGIFDRDSIDNIINSKYTTIRHFFGGSSPLSREELKRGHLKFLATKVKG